MKHPSRSVSTLISAAVLGVSLVAAPLVALPAAASTDGTGVIINEAYLNGGSAGATYLHKFVELYNPTAADVSLDGTSIQYRSATGVVNPTGTIPLSGTIEAGGYYLVQGSSNAANGAALPTPDAALSVSFAGGSGTIFFADQATALTTPPVGSIVGNPAIIDLLGYGSSNTYEGTASTAASVTTSVNRSSFVTAMSTLPTSRPRPRPPRTQQGKLQRRSSRLRPIPPHPRTPRRRRTSLRSARSRARRTRAPSSVPPSRPRESSRRPTRPADLPGSTCRPPAPAA